MFAKYHYLNGSLNRTAQCYLGMIDGPAGGVLARCCRSSATPAGGGSRRIVVRPDFQGVGVGRAVLNAVAAMYPRMSITTGHPAMIAALKNDANWKCTAVKKTGHARHRGAATSFTGGPIRTSSRGRVVCSFERRRLGARDWGLGTRSQAASPSALVPNP